MSTEIRILIVDHHDESRQSVVQQLEKQIYSVLDVSCEVDALKHRLDSFDALITDVNLPKRFHGVVQDGLGIILALELRKTYSAIGVLFYSSDEKYVRQAEELYRSGDGGTGYLSKDSTMKVDAMLPIVLSGNWICTLTRPSSLNIGLEELYLRGLADTSRKIVLDVVERLHELKEDEKLTLKKIGQNNVAIAEELNLSKNTIETRLTIIYSKLRLDKMDRRLRSILLDRALAIFSIRENSNIHP